MCPTEEQRQAGAPRLEALPEPPIDNPAQVSPPSPTAQVIDEHATTDFVEHVSSVQNDGNRAPVTPLGLHNPPPDTGTETDHELEPPASSRYIGYPHIDTAVPGDRRTTVPRRQRKPAHQEHPRHGDAMRYLRHHCLSRNQAPRRRHPKSMKEHLQHSQKQQTTARGGDGGMAAEHATPTSSGRRIRAPRAAPYRQRRHHSRTHH